ncbi:MAG: DNA recombination protein RmuC [Parvularculaceae bacterium]
MLTTVLAAFLAAALVASTTLLARARRADMRLRRVRRMAAALRAENEEQARRLAALDAEAEATARGAAAFEDAAARALSTAQETLLRRVDDAFARHRDGAAAEMDARRAGIDALVAPMRAALERCEAGLAEQRAEAARSRGELIGRIGERAQSANDVRGEAQRLASALTAGPAVAGRWGEAQLRNVVEAAGMRAHVDFVEQRGTGGDARGRPDMVVNLPGARKIAVDAKASLGAYFAALEADDPSKRLTHLKRHADDLWAHVKTLAARDYAASMRGSLDAVVMFVPGENFLAAAAEARPTLFQEAFDRRVLVAAPTTLFAMLKAASFNWRQENAAENAMRLAEFAKELNDSLSAMSANLSGLGRALDGAVGKYNAVVGGFEARVLPRARRFAECELPGVDAAPTSPAPVDARARNVGA